MASPLSSQRNEEVIGTKEFIKRVEFVRILTEALYSLGYAKSGKVLEEESGIQLYSPVVDLFRAQVLARNWNGSLATLHEIGIQDGNVMKSAAFLILEQKFFELLVEERIMDALEMLRNEITPLSINKKRVHELCSCVVSPLQHVLIGFTNMGVDASNSVLMKFECLAEIQKLLPPTVIVPERRLENLVEQALTVQREACYFHNSLDKTLSLYTDHQCGKTQIPSRTVQVLPEHQGDIWYLQFSNNGKYLASASDDKSVIIWKVQDGLVSLRHILSGFQKPVLMVAWSPDDSELLTCGIDRVVRRWDVSSRKCLNVYKKSKVGLISCGWNPDGNCFFSGTTDKSICLWNLEGKEIECWKGQSEIKASDMAITKDGRRIISMSKSAIVLLDRETKLDMIIPQEHLINSFSLSRDDNFLLVNAMNREIHLWSIADKPVLVKRYKDHERSKLMIRSCFGGSDQAFIASGSEDSQVRMLPCDLEVTGSSCRNRLLHKLQDKAAYSGISVPTLPRTPHIAGACSAGQPIS